MRVLHEGVGVGVHEPEPSTGDHRAALLALAERLQWDFPRVSNILQTRCTEGTDDQIEDLYGHLAAFPQAVEPLAKRTAVFPVCAYCGEPLDSNLVTGQQPQYHGRCLRESYRIGQTDFMDPR